MKEPVFKGSCTAMITPFTETGIDFRRMGELLDYQEKNGTAAVLIAGTTGENATLEIHEYEQLVDFCCKYAAGKMKVIVGVGGNCTAECVRRAQYASGTGADAVLMCAPYYNKTTQPGLVAHFTAAADAASVPLILYNVPSRTGIGISLDSYRELSRHPNINGVKEASGDIALAGRIFSECCGDLNLWSGNDDVTVPLMALGAQGVISVASNVIPETLSVLCSLCRDGSYKAASELYFRYSRFFAALFAEVNPIPVKAAMTLLGLDSGRLRAPLVPVSDRAMQLLIDSMKECGIIY